MADDSGRTIRVLWLTKGLGPGGAERLLVSFAHLADRSRFSIHAAYLLPQKDHLVRDLRQALVRTTCLEGRRTYDLRWVLRLRRLVRQEQIDAVHVHSPLVAAVARIGLRTLRRQPVIVGTEHNSWRSHHRLTRWANRYTHFLENATIAVSDEVRASMPPRLAERTEVLVHGVDTAAIGSRRCEREKARRDLAVGEDELLVVAVANLRSNKDYPTMLTAARELVDSGMAVRFVSVGQGPLEGELHALRDRLGLKGRFEFLGYLPDPVRVVVGADVFCMSSRFEGLPIALLEALAAGVPVAATTAGGIPSVVTDGVEGFLVSPGDPNGLAAAIRKLGEPGTRARCAKAALQRGQDFSMEHAVQRQQELYTSLAGRHEPLVLHVVPQDLARGAQVHARELRQRLDGHGARHRLMLLFGTERSVTQADHTLAAPRGIGRRAGFSPSAYLRLVAHILREKPTVVIAHGGESMKYVGLLPVRAAKIYHRIGSPTADVRRTSGGLYRMLARRFDHLVGVGTEITEEARAALGFPAGWTSVIHNGRDVDEFRPGTSERRGPVRLLFVGHLHPGKRPETFAQVASRLGQAKVTATVVGDGPLLDQLRSDHPAVRFLGRRSDIADILRDHDLFVFPSAPAGEGLPGVLIEAALSGLPTVATAVPGAGEVIVDGVTGYLVPPGDDEALARAVETLVMNPAERSRMAVDAREHALRHFDISGSAEKWQVLIAQLARPT